MWLRQALKRSFACIHTVDSRSMRMASHLRAHVRSEVSAFLKGSLPSTLSRSVWLWRNVGSLFINNPVYMLTCVVTPLEQAAIGVTYVLLYGCQKVVP